MHPRRGRKKHRPKGKVVYGDAYSKNGHERRRTYMNSNRKEIEANLSPDHFNDHLMAWMYANGTVFDGEEVESVTYNIDDLNKKGDGTFPVVIKLKQKEGARAVERDEEITI